MAILEILNASFLVRRCIGPEGGLFKANHFKEVSRETFFRKIAKVRSFAITHNGPTKIKGIALLCCELAQLRFTNCACVNIFPSLFYFRVGVARMKRNVVCVFRHSTARLPLYKARFHFIF